MKKLLISLVLFLIACPMQARKMSREELEARGAQMGTCIKKLAGEINTGFTARRGARLRAGVDGEERYATPALDCFDADDQYISVKDGKAFYNVLLKGESSFNVLLAAMNIISNKAQALKDGLYYWEGTNISAPKDEWYDHYTLREGSNNGPVVVTYVTMKGYTKTLISIGLAPDYGKARDAARAASDAQEYAKRRAEYKPTGNAELDSINLYLFSATRKGDYLEAQKLKQLYAVDADNYYGNTVGEAYKAPDGSTRYHSPLLFGADEAFYRKDTGGSGTILYLFFAAGKPHTEEMLGTLRHLFAYDPNGKVGKPGAHEFVYLARGEASNIMYRYDESADAAYRGITVIVYQSYRLAERLAAQARHDAATAAIRQSNAGNNGAQSSGGYGICSCCGGKGYTETYTPSIGYVYEGRSGAQTTTKFLRSTCSCCHGSGK